VEKYADRDWNQTNVKEFMAETGKVFSWLYKNGV